MRRFFMQYILFFAILVIVGTYGSLAIGGYRINLTPSYPVGVYKIIEGEIAHGDFVIACPFPSALTVYARDKGYLFYGTCPGAYSTLLKQVMATPGDIVSRTQGHSLVVNGRTIPNSQFIHFAPHGLDLPLPPVGKVPKNEFWLLSDYRSDSFDSRYLGTFHRQNIVSKVVPVWIAK